MAVPARALLRGVTSPGGGGRELSSSSGTVGLGATLQLDSKMASSGVRVLTGPWATRVPLFSLFFFLLFLFPDAVLLPKRGAEFRCINPHRLPSPIISLRPHPPLSRCGPLALVLRVCLHPASAGFFKNGARSLAVARCFSPLLSLFSSGPGISSWPVVPVICCV